MVMFGEFRIDVKPFNRVEVVSFVLLHVKPTATGSMSGLIRLLMSFILLCLLDL